MRFLDIRRIGWDTETTASDPTDARIVTAALVGRGGNPDDRVQTWLINPGIPIPPETTEVHGITDAMVQADGQDPKAALEEIAAIMARAIAYGMPFVAFNTAYDWTVLNFELARHGLPTMGDRLGDTVPTLVDPHVIDKQVDKYVKGTGMRKLKPTCERYGIELTDWHTAEADALAALLIAEAQFDRYPQLNDLGPQQLFAAQKAWRAEQQAGLQKWFRTKATPEQGGAPDKVIDGSWPLIIPAQRGDDA
ncbi:exonuclease domain-containing protein [Streptomyces sp. NRRL B-24720]|uniref:exonuclease domain-containing protein n=1 Tax=Streptomyces sp. NRRL B-24720 TaxID=1476876 RepID=UPI000561D1AB|nr:exonuclease domain-containing protein [Streptomyces sp. NRRL B-24720]